MTIPSIAATITFSGDVPADFTGPGVLTILDPGGVGDVGLPGVATPGTTSGWDMVGFRLSYDSGADILYVGINAFGIGGDADGDGLPGNTSGWLTGTGGADVADLGGTESFAVYFDLDQDGTFDVIAGVPSGSDITGFTVSNFSGSPGSPFSAFGTAIATSAGSALYANPSLSAPDLEFTITNFSQLPGQTGSNNLLGGFEVRAFMGSQEDDGIGEDYITYVQSPSTDVGISAEAIDAGTVDLTVTENNDSGDGTPLTNVEVVVNDGSSDIAVLDKDNVTSGDGGVTGVLEDGETWIWSYTTVAALENIAVGTGKTFTATGIGTDEADIVVTVPGDLPGDPDEEESVTVTPLPVIKVVKTVDCEVAVDGDPVYYTICIQNIGPVEVTPTLVSDDKIGDLTADFLVAYPTLAAGTPSVPTEGCLTFGPYYQDELVDPNINTVTFSAEATANPSNTAGPVTDTATVNLVHPSLLLVKSCTSLDPVEPGGVAFFRIQLTNTGDVDLLVDITDIDDADCDTTGLSLPEGSDTWTCDLSITVPADFTGPEFINHVTASWSIDSENLCLADITGTENDEAPCDVTGGATRTPGFWKTHTVFAEHVLFEHCGGVLDLGFVELDSIDEVCAYFWANAANNTDGSKRNKLCQARMHAAFHAIAALLNNCVPSGGGIPVSPEVIALILGGDDIGAIKDLASILADYNESGDYIALIDPDAEIGSATPQDCRGYDQSIADCEAAEKPGKGPK